VDKDDVFCAKCNRKLVDLTFDKCMYCGEVLPEELRLSKIEKEKQINEKEERYQELTKEHKLTKKTGNGGSCGSAGGGSFGEDCGGGGDGGGF